jgi:hypothetical protein
MFYYSSVVKPADSGFILRPPAAVLLAGALA